MANRINGATAPKSPLQSAQEAMQDVHIVAMADLDAIQSVAKLATLAFANAGLGPHLRTVLAAFEHIHSLANGLQNDIDVYAGHIGCNVAASPETNTSGVQV